MSKFVGSLTSPEPARGTSSPERPKSAPTAAYSSSPHSPTSSGVRRGLPAASVMLVGLHPDHAVPPGRGVARGNAPASDGRNGRTTSSYHRRPSSPAFPSSPPARPSDPVA